MDLTEISKHPDWIKYFKLGYSLTPEIEFPGETAKIAYEYGKNLIDYELELQQKGLTLHS